MGTIYCFTNKINQKKYVGQSVDPVGRYRNHKSAYNNESNNEYNSPLHRAMRKYGFENFTYEILINNISDIDQLNELEIYYITLFDCQIPNGYNIEPGGRNSHKPQSEEQKQKESWSHGKLSKEEIIELRKAYKAIQSPTEIYNEKYKDRLTWQSFMNIWTGKRYNFVMPEVFIDRSKKTKLNLDLARQIRKEREETGISHQELAKKYGVGRTTITNILNNKSWKEPN